MDDHHAASEIEVCETMNLHENGLDRMGWRAGCGRSAGCRYGCDGRSRGGVVGQREGRITALNHDGNAEQGVVIGRREQIVCSTDECLYHPFIRLKISPVFLSIVLSCFLSSFNLPKAS